jgi:5'-nucleotidase
MSTFYPFPGSHFINKMSRIMHSKDSETEQTQLQQSTMDAISREITRQRSHIRKSTDPGSIASLWKQATSAVLHWSRSRTHYRDQLRVCGSEHMSLVDSLDGKSMRAGVLSQENPGTDEDLLTVHPQVDGRLADEGRK